MRWILAVGVSCFGAATWGTFLPLRRETGLEYLFVWPGAPAFVAVAAVAVVAAAYSVVVSVELPDGMKVDTRRIAIDAKP